MVIRGIILNNLDSFVSLSNSGFGDSIFLTFIELPGIIAFYFLFLILQWLVNKNGGLSIWKQVLISILAVFLIGCFSDLHDFRFLLNANEYSWRKIIGAQFDRGSQFFTFLFFSIIFALSQFYFIEKKR